MNSSVTVRACASQAKVCAISFEKRDVCVVNKSRTSRGGTSWLSHALTMGRRPKATCQFSARSLLGKTPYSKPHLTSPTNHTYAKKCNTFSEHHSSSVHK